MKSKWLGFVSSVVLGAGLLAGCSSNSSGSSLSTSNKKVEITVMQSKVEIESDFEKFVDDFNKSQNKIEVKVLGMPGGSTNYNTALQSQFASTPAEAPTIFNMTGANTARFQNFMAPLDSAKAASMTLPSLANDVKEGATVNGKLYGLPTSLEGYGLIYNKQLFQKANIDPKSLTTIDAVVAASKKLQKLDGVKSALAYAKDNYFVFMQPFSWGFQISKDYRDSIDKVNNNKLALKDIPGVKQVVLDLAKLKPYTNNALDSYDEEIAGFANGSYAMIHQGTWTQPLLDQQKVNFEYGMIPFPTSGNTKMAVGIANYWRVNKYATPEQQKAAITFLDYLLTSDQGQSFLADKAKFISAYQGTKSNTTNPLARELAPYISSGKIVPWAYTLFPPGYDVDGASAMQQFYSGVINSNHLLDELNQAWQKDVSK